MVGIARTSYLEASSLLSSTFTLPIFKESECSEANSSHIGPIALHGPHHGAQKSTKTVASLALMNDSNEVLSRSVIFSDIGLFFIG